MAEIVKLLSNIRQEPDVLRLLDEMLQGNIGEVKPTLDLATELGFTYPSVESLLGIATQKAIDILEFLANEQILEKQFHDKLLFCPYCRSPNLRPSLRCPKCGSGDIVKGRILEHFSCANIGIEDEYSAAGKYICPKCKKELRFLGTDYRSLGINYKCNSCGEISTEVTLKWQCLKCSVLFAQDEAKETVLYLYRINEDRRFWLEFELGPKARFMEFLKSQGYEITEKAKISSASKSGAAHVFDILAQRDDGFITYTMGIDTIISNSHEPIGLEAVFKFDNKAYDLGINDKVLLVAPGLNQEAKQFAQRQKIKVFEIKELELLLASASPSAPKQMKKQPFRFSTKAELIEYLKNLGYKVEEEVKVQGRSGATHILDILARYNDGIITHTVGIGIIAAKNEVNLDAVSLFDTRAFDLDIHDKVLLISPHLSREAKQFARQQRIKVIEVDDPAKLK